MTERNLNTDKILIDILSGNKISDILNDPEEFPADLIEKLSLETALKYWNGEFNYSDGDYIMNHLYGFWMSNENYYKKYGFDEIAWECYLAFDAGEYYRENDDRSIVPAEKYTKPLVEAVLKKQQII